MPKILEIQTMEWNLQQKWLKTVVHMGTFQNYLDRWHLYIQEWLSMTGLGQAQAL